MRCEDAVHDVTDSSLVNQNTTISSSNETDNFTPTSAMNVAASQPTPFARSQTKSTMPHQNATPANENITTSARTSTTSSRSRTTARGRTDFPTPHPHESKYGNYEKKIDCLNRVCKKLSNSYNGNVSNSYNGNVSNSYNGNISKL